MKTTNERITVSLTGDALKALRILSALGGVKPSVYVEGLIQGKLSKGESFSEFLKRMSAKKSKRG